MKLTDNKELLSSSYEEKYDLYIMNAALPSFEELCDLSADIKTLVLLPAGLYPTGSERVAVYNRTDTVFDRSPSLCLADAHLMNEENFRHFTETGGYGRIIIPFAELSDETEYGTCRGYRWTGEWRSSTTRYCQLICLFSLKVNAENFRNFYSPNVKCISVDAGGNPANDYRIIKADDLKKKFTLTLREITKKAGQTSAVFFSTREECLRFAGYCKTNGIKICVVTGESGAEEIKYAVSMLISGKTETLVCTKSALSLFPLIHPDRIIYCGVPFSRSHLARCLSSGGSGTVVYCDEDSEKAEKLILNYTEGYCEGAGDIIYKEKINMLHQLEADF